MNTQEININDLTQEELELIRQKRESEKTEEQKKAEAMEAWFEHQVKRHKEDIQKRAALHQRKIDIMVDVEGAVEGVDWKEKHEWYDADVTFTYQDDYVSGEGWKTKVPRTFQFKSFRGEVTIFHKSWNRYSKELREHWSTFDIFRENDKYWITCEPITDSYNRKYTPKTIFKKAKENIQSAELANEQHKKSLNIRTYTAEKYRKLFPEAVVTETTYTVRHGSQTRDWSEYEGVKVQFPSGSYMILSLGWGKELDKETIHKFHDATTSGRTPQDLGAIFNQQPAKEQK